MNSISRRVNNKVQSNSIHYSKKLNYNNFKSQQMFWRKYYRFSSQWNVQKGTKS